MTESRTLLPPDEFIISRLGDCIHPSPMRGMAFTPDNDGVLYHTLKTEIQPYLEKGLEFPAFEMAGPSYNFV